MQSSIHWVTPHVGNPQTPRDRERMPWIDLGCEKGLLSCHSFSCFHFQPFFFFFNISLCFYPFLWLPKYCLIVKRDENEKHIITREKSEQGCVHGKETGKYSYRNVFFLKMNIPLTLTVKIYTSLRSPSPRWCSALLGSLLLPEGLLLTFIPCSTGYRRWAPSASVSLGEKSFHFPFERYFHPFQKSEVTDFLFQDLKASAPLSLSLCCSWWKAAVTLIPVPLWLSFSSGALRLSLPRWFRVWCAVLWRRFLPVSCRGFMRAGL